MKPLINIDVCVSVTMSKTVTISTDNYNSVNGKPDFSETDLLKEVQSQVFLPNDAQYIVRSLLGETSDEYKDLSGWNIDEIEAIKE